VQLQIVFSQWCIWGCRSPGWHCHWASSSQHLEEHSAFMFDPWKWRYYIPSKHQRPHPSNSVLSHKTWILISAVIYCYEMNSARKTRKWRMFRERKLKARQGKHLISQNYICHVFLTSFLVCVLFRLIVWDTCHLTVHTYFICSSNTWKLCIWLYVYMTLTCCCLHTYS